MHLHLDAQQIERLISAEWWHQYFTVTSTGGSRERFGDVVSLAYRQYVARYDLITHLIGMAAAFMGIAWIGTAFGPLHGLGLALLVLAVALGLWALKRSHAWEYCGSEPYRTARLHAHTEVLRRVARGEITVTGEVPEHEVEYLPRELRKRE